MGEHELGKALLKLDALNISGVPDDRQLTWRVLERDRRRVRWLTGLTIGVWLLAVLMIFKVLVGLALLMPAQAKLKIDSESGKITAAELARLDLEYKIGFEMASVVIAFSVAVLAVAAFLTVLLTLASRRATLRQINAGLREISEQLRVLQIDDAPGKPRR